MINRFLFWLLLRIYGGFIIKLNNFILLNNLKRYFQLPLWLIFLFSPLFCTVNLRFIIKIGETEVTTFFSSSFSLSLSSLFFVLSPSTLRHFLTILFTLSIRSLECSALLLILNFNYSKKKKNSFVVMAFEINFALPEVKFTIFSLFIGSKRHVNHFQSYVTRCTSSGAIPSLFQNL